jgi:mRNA interferase YafQ
VSSTYFSIIYINLIDINWLKKSGKNLAELQKVTYQLAIGEPLEPFYSDHPLLGSYRGCRECHLEPNWLLIYKTEETELALVRTGSHSELF